MRKVANKKTVRNLAFSMLRADKKKNIAIVVAVMLTSILFTTLFSVGISMIKTAQRSDMRQVGGSSMAELKYGRSEDYEKLKKDSKIKDISYRIIVGELADERLKGMVNEVYYATDENAKGTFAYPTIGTMPEKQNEIVLSSLTLEKLGLPQKTGQRISLKLLVGAEEITDEFVLSGIYEGDVVSLSQVVYVSKAYQEMVAPEPEESYYTAYPMYYTGYWSINFNFNHSFNIKKQTEDLLLRNGYDLQKVQYGVNWAYAASSVDPATLLLFIAVLLLILVAGYLIIYNIFYIRVTTDIHAYGLLKTIGTTGRQLKKIMRIQANVMAAIGIPSGLLLGSLVSWYVFPLILENLTMDAEDVVFSVHPFIYIFSAVFSYLTIRIGCKKSQKIVSKVSPVEAVTYTQIDRIRKKKKKSKRVTVFTLAKENLRRERKKAFIVVLSFTLSIELVNGIYCVVTGLDQEKYLSNRIIGDYNIFNATRKDPRLLSGDVISVPQEDIAYLGQIDGITACSNIYCDRFAWTDMSKEAEQKIKELYEICQDDMYKEDVRSNLTEKFIACDYYGIDSYPIAYMDFEDGRFDEALWKTGEYAIVYGYQLLDDSQEDVHFFYEAGDEITVTLSNDYKKTYKIMAIAEMPYSMSTQGYSTVGCQVIVPQEEYLKNAEDKGALVSVLNAEEEQDTALEDTIKNYVEASDYLMYVSKQTYLDEFDTFIRSMVLIGGGLAVILGIIGIINFANSVITGIHRRSRELSMMQAVGLTDRQMTGMLVLEGIMQGVVVIVFSMILWLTLGMVLVEGLAGQIWYFKYHFTITPIFICIPFILIIVIVIPLVTCGHMKKQSIVERMRME